MKEYSDKIRRSKSKIAREIRYQDYAGKRNPRVKDESKAKLGPAAQLANLLEMDYPVEEAIKKIEKDFGFFVEGWLNAAKKMLENRKALNEGKTDNEAR